MKSIVGLILLFLISCELKQVSEPIADNPSSKTLNRTMHEQDDLFMLQKNIGGQWIKIIPPKNSNFELPDSAANIEPYKYDDFNADGKEDILLYLGACGTGGCMYGLFLNQFDNFYKLAFMDYLKNAVFKIEKNGLWTIESSEEIEPYNPSKIHITIFKFYKNTYKYEIDTTYVYNDKDEDTTINEIKKEPRVNKE